MKQYTAKEVALEVLKKAEECLKKSALLKKEKDATPPDGVKAQVAPEKNPKENKEKEGTHPTGTADVEDKRLKKAEKESKHDRCVEHVKENSPEVKNPHAVCVAEGVKPEAWKKSEGVANLAKFMEDVKSKRLSKGSSNG